MYGQDQNKMLLEMILVKIKTIVRNIQIIQIKDLLMLNIIKAKIVVNDKKEIHLQFVDISFKSFNNFKKIISLLEQQVVDLLGYKSLDIVQHVIKVAYILYGG